MKKLGASVVGKADVIKNDVAVKIRLGGSLPVGFDRRRQNVVQTIKRNTGLAQLRDHTSESADRPGKHRVIGKEGNQLSRGHTSVDTKVNAEKENEHHLCSGDHVTHPPKAGHQL